VVIVTFNFEVLPIKIKRVLHPALDGIHIRQVKSSG
jgi:hypothetical protein